VVEELAPHLPLELDFEHEAANLARCARFFASSGLRDRVALPDVLPQLSSHRVLTMTFEEGCSVTDKSALLRMGLSPASVARLLSEAFCALVFEAGFVHCDPHPGNGTLARTLTSPHCDPHPGQAMARPLPRAHGQSPGRDSSP
jgi:aarF domain-containing kinase